MVKLDLQNKTLAHWSCVSNKRAYTQITGCEPTRRNDCEKSFALLRDRQLRLHNLWSTLMLSFTISKHSQMTRSELSNNSLAWEVRTCVGFCVAADAQRYVSPCKLGCCTVTMKYENSLKTAVWQHKDWTDLPTWFLECCWCAGSVPTSHLASYRLQPQTVTAIWLTRIVHSGFCEPSFFLLWPADCCQQPVKVLTTAEMWENVTSIPCSYGSGIASTVPCGLLSASRTA